jgi:uncharacterized protein (DUF2141 family)
MNFVALISNAFGAVKEFFGFRREESNRQNAPEMKAAAKAAQDAKTVDESRAAVKRADVDEIRRDLS